MDWLFRKPIQQITIDDLRQQLSDRPEGWYVEYKGPDAIDQNDTIAKAIAALANTYGGWLFIGIVADAQHENKPLASSGFSGFDRSKVDEDAIHQAIPALLDPGPYFETNVVAVDAQDATSNRILAIRVEESDDPPLIRRSDGKVFVRRGSTSQPVKDRDWEGNINSRGDLEKLYEKAVRNQYLVSERVNGHQGVDRFIVRRQYAEYRKAVEKSASPGRSFVCGVCYPMSAGFRVPDLFGYSGEPIQALLDVSESLRSYFETRSVSPGIFPVRLFPDQHTMQSIAANGEYAVQVDEFGHLMISRLLENGAQSADLSKVDSLPKIGAEIFQHFGYFGRVGLQVTFGRILWPGPEMQLTVIMNATLARIVAAAELGSMDLDDLKPEAARALGQWNTG